MAENDGAQNQGKQPQPDNPNETAGELADQKKLDRAAKERERRRRRRRRKAELRRLARETLQQEPKPEPEEIPELKRKPEEPPKPEVQPSAKKETALLGVPSGKKAPRKRQKPKMPNIPKEPAKIENTPAPDERHVILRSEEHAPRSKNIVPQAEPEKPLQEQKPVPGEAPPPEEQPSGHQTHNFVGPLIEPAPPAEPAPPVETTPSPVEPEPTPQPQPQKKSPENEEIIIHDRREERRPMVEMGPMNEEEENIPGVHSIFPEQPQKKEEREIEEEPEEINPVKEAPMEPEEDKNKHERRESSRENLPESEGLHVRKSFLESAGGFSAGVLKSIGSAFGNFHPKIKLRSVLIFLGLVVLGGGLYAGYLFKVHEKVYNYVADFFKTPPPVEVHMDEDLLKQWGITTALIFGDNRGSTKDLLASQLYNAYYFGRLKEPSVQGETGITASYYYGKSLDVVAGTNQFIGYINNLRELVSSYDVDVYAMLDQTTQRDQALDAYLAKLNDIQDKSTQIVKELNAEIDDLKVSYDSLNPDRTKFESDFFVALQGLAAEKSDFLLKSFTDVTQKQAALKAREAALVQLLSYYTSSMQKLAVRISAVEKNREALVQGIHVVDIPGANLDIIIKEGQ